MSDAIERIEALPIWHGSIAIQPLHGGLSNESYTVADAGRRFVVRLGRGFPFHHVSREREVMTARAAFAAGLAPEVVYAEPGLMVSAFVEGRTFGEDDVRADLDRVADLVRGFHETMAAHVSGPGFMFWPFHVIRDYAHTLRKGGSRFTPDLEGYVELANAMEEVQPPLPIRFAHNDLLPANFLDDGKRLWLIDFEYAGYSTAMFDLAGIASNAGFDAEMDARLLDRYFGASNTPELRRGHAAMKCASLLREAMWSMVSELYLEAPGVDYEAYTQENLERLAEALDRYRSAYSGS